MTDKVQPSDVPGALNDIANFLYDIGEVSSGSAVAELARDLRFMRRLRLIQGVLVYQPDGARASGIDSDE